MFVFFLFWFKLLTYIAQRLNLVKKIEGISLNWELELQIDENLGAYWTNLTGIAQMRTFV